MGHVAVLCVVKVSVPLWVNVRGCDNSQHMGGGAPQTGHSSLCELLIP